VARAAEQDGQCARVAGLAAHEGEVRDPRGVRGLLQSGGELFECCHVAMVECLTAMLLCIQDSGLGHGRDARGVVCASSVIREF
jgi:hypothetical protein